MKTDLSILSGELNTANLNNLIKKRAVSKKQIDILNAQLKEAKAEQELIDIALLKKLDSEELSRGADKDKRFSVSINEAIVPEVEDWTVFSRYVLETQDLSLLHRRVSTAAFNELIKLGDMPAGVKPRTVRRINFKTL